MKRLTVILFAALAMFSCAPKQQYANRAEKILAEIKFIQDTLKDTSSELFLEDERTIRAVCMTLINIGELVKNLTPELKDAHKEIPWRAISGMRDITAHKYQTLRKEDVYSTCVDDIPDFEKQLLRLVQESE